MTTTRLITVSSLTVLILGGVLFSFSNKTEDSEFRKIEVIRTVDGVSTTYDTLVSSLTDFGAKDYLAELGFDKDKNICIIELSSDLENFDCSALFNKGDGKSSGTGCAPQITIETSVDDEESMVTEKTCSSEKNVNCGPEGVKCMKMVMAGGKCDAKMECDFSGLAELCNISCLDSLMKGCKFESKCDTSFQNGNCKIICMTDVKCDTTNTKNCLSWSGTPGSCKIDIDVKMDGSDAMNTGACHKFSMAGCFAEGGSENCTMVIVTEDADPTRAAENASSDLENAMKFYPNPATDEVKLQIDLVKKRDTKITVTNMNGNVMKTFDLGKFSGSVTERIDISEWSSGVYLVRLTSGEYSRVEKLVVQ